MSATLDDLAPQPIWVAWKYEPREPGKPPTKVPYRARGRRGRASANKPEEWGTREEAAARAGEGVGIQLTQVGTGAWLCGIDLDTCRDPISGNVEPWSQAVVERFGSYTEISPSETGLKVFFFLRDRADSLAAIAAAGGGEAGMKWARAGVGEHPPAIELFLGKRFFTVTGRAIRGGTSEVREVDPADVRWLIEEHGPDFAGRGRDGSRSGAAFRKAQEMHRAGASYDEFVAALRADPATAGWYRDKGAARGEREVHRAWDRAAQNEAKATRCPEVTELNKTFAVVTTGGKVAVIREYRDADGPTFGLMTADDFRLVMENKPDVAVGDGFVPLSKFWLGHSGRREYEGIDFMPAAPLPGWYNLWHGLPVAPIPGGCDMFLAHLRDNVALGDEGLYRWIVGWLADIVQNPDRKPGTALVLRGEQGAGKTIVGKTMGRLLGRYHLAVSSQRYLTGQFNSHLAACLLLQAEEAFWAGNRGAEGVLKDLVTGDKLMIEYKGVNPFSVRNYTRLLVTSNSDWVVPAGMEERRFAVVAVSNARARDRAYFAAIQAELDDGGYEALLDYLLAFDLGSVDVATIPKTEALLEQKIETLKSVDGWWHELLRAGRMPGCCPGGPNTCSVRALYKSYLDYEGMVRERSMRASETKFGISLRRLSPVSSAGKPNITRFKGEYLTHKDDKEAKRGWLYELAPLKECRHRFEDLMGQPLKWDEGDGGPVDWEKDELPSLWSGG